jgi:hypothetical protein
MKELLPIITSMLTSRPRMVVSFATVPSISGSDGTAHALTAADHPATVLLHRNLGPLRSRNNPNLIKVISTVLLVTGMCKRSPPSSRNGLTTRTAVSGGKMFCDLEALAH